MPIKQPTGDQFNIESSMYAIELYRNHIFQTYVGTCFFSLYEEGKESPIPDDKRIEPDSSLFLLIREPSMIERIMNEHIPSLYYCSIEARYARFKLIKSERLSNEYNIGISSNSSFTVIFPNQKEISISVPTELNKQTVEKGDNCTLYIITLNSNDFQYESEGSYQFRSITDLIDEILRLADI